MPEPTLYERLSVQVPESILIKYEVDDGKMLTTYPAQYAIDLLNKEVGYGGYVVTTDILTQQIIGKAWMVAVKVNILLGKDSMFEGFGAEYAHELDTALKAAKTKAFKHACRFMGIGKELYYDQIEEVKVSTKVTEVEEAPSGITALLDKISKAETLPYLEELLKDVETINGEKLKAMLIKAYNTQKIKLSE